MSHTVPCGTGQTESPRLPWAPHPIPHSGRMSRVPGWTRPQAPHLETGAGRRDLTRRDRGAGLS